MRIEDRSDDDLVELIRYIDNKEEYLKYLQDDQIKLRQFAVQAENELYRRGKLDIARHV